MYISYAWKNKDNPYIETDVDNLCKAMDAAGIFYKRDKDGLCPYRYSIQNAEEEIGQGCAIIMAISKKYIESIHCMNEWHFIRENGKIWERVFPIVLPCANITDEKVYNEYYEYFQKRKDTIIEKQRKGISDLTKVEASAAETGYFLEDLKKLQKFVADYNMGKSIIRDNNYSVVIDQLTAHLNSIMPHQEEKTEPSKKVSTTSEKHSAKWLWIVAVAIILAGLGYVIKSNTESSADVDTIAMENKTVTENKTDADSEKASNWPYGEWTGGTKNGKPHGNNVTVIYRTECVYNSRDPLKRKAKPGQKVVGMYENGMLIIGDIYDENGNLIEQDFEPKM